MIREKELQAVEEIHKASMKILSEIGIKFGLDEVNEIFKKHGFIFFPFLFFLNFEKLSLI